MNLDHLRRLMGNDETMVQHFLSLLAHELPKQLNTLETALQSGKLEQAHIIAHAIKGQLSYLGATDLCQAAEELELLTNAPADASAGVCMEHYMVFKGKLLYLMNDLQLKNS